MEIGAGSSQGLTGKMSKKGVLLEDKESRACDVEDEKRKKKPSTPTLMVMKWCQAEKCAADLTEAKAYYRRHKVCEVHSKCPNVLVAGLHQRFCQQCSRFHELWEFDDAKRSCRRRLAGHNERRRKSAADQCQPCRGVPLRAGQAEG